MDVLQEDTLNWDTEVIALSFSVETAS